ncbi:uncharacterized protein ATC70_009104 [Mucor velutinosus]|uniref:Uncharacterized protein n=1 Tax=Mucor velutinosus TaxID=708070 RepID=A0AAN7DLN2_9FUNG|nr:hypothetical protein ATC70_009104 [Mucor velutinosus]
MLAVLRRHRGHINDDTFHAWVLVDEVLKRSANALIDNVIKVSSNTSKVTICTCLHSFSTVSTSAVCPSLEPKQNSSEMFKLAQSTDKGPQKVASASSPQSKTNLHWAKSTKDST